MSVTFFSATSKVTGSIAQIALSVLLQSAMTFSLPPSGLIVIPERQARGTSTQRMRAPAAVSTTKRPCPAMTYASDPSEVSTTSGGALE